MKIFAFAVPALAFWLLAPTEASAQIVINEWVSSNVDNLVIENGEAPDWIEICNQGASTVNLEGYALSDDPLDLAKWVFPSVFLPPQDYFLVFASNEDRRVFANEFTTIVTQGDLWRYFEGIQEPPVDWNTLGFDDSGWLLGPSGFGFGDGDDATLVSADTVYIRHVFSLQQVQLDQMTMAYLHVDYDDAFVACLNGVEIARGNIGVPGPPPAFDEFSDNSREARLYRGLKLSDDRPIEDFANLFQLGDNVLAVQVHNDQAGGDDLSLVPFLSIGTAVENPTGGGHPPELLFPMTLLHTNFELNVAGEALFLTDPNGFVVDTASTGALKVDFSRGRDLAGGADLVYQIPTPLKRNSTEGRPEFSVPLTLTPEGGVYMGPTTVSMSHPGPGAVIHYTLDAREPTESDPVYTAPVTLSSSISVLRARAFETGKWPSDIATGTYVKNKTATLPVFSLVTDPPNLWDADIGIYVLGNNYNPDPPYYGANFWQDWERPVHLELIETDGSVPLRFDAGMKIHGGWTRIKPQKSLRILARGGYGLDSVEYPLFGAGGLSSFKRFLLRNAGNDWSRAQMRDAVAHEIARGEDLDTMDYRPSLVLLNGEFWGVHHIRERIDKNYLKSHHGVDPDDIDFLEDNQEVTEGDADHYRAMLDFIKKNDLAIEANYRHVQTLMDTDNYATYNIFEIFFGNDDWPDNNTKYWRPRTANGRWRWFLFDLDTGLSLHGGPQHDTLAMAQGKGSGAGLPAWSTFLFTNMLRNAEFKRDFINRYADYLNTRLRSDQSLPVATAVGLPIKDAMRLHMKRWAIPFQRWVLEARAVEDFLMRRPQFASDHILQEFGLAGTYQLDLDVQPAGAGAIRLEAIQVDEGWSGSYFLGNPVTLTAIPTPGFEFVDWSDPGLPLTATVEINPAGNYSVTANFQPGGPAAVINEINYNSAPGFDPGDWVEIHNDSDQTLDLSNWSFRDEADPFSVPAGTVVAPRGYLVLCSDLALFQTLFPSVAPVLGDLGFGFKGSGEQLSLHRPDGSLFDIVIYDDEPPWPTQPDGNGPTLELNQPNLDNAVAASWSASLAVGGSPGAKNSVTP